MNIFLYSLLILTITAGLLAVIALYPQNTNLSRFANRIAPIGIVLGCVTGLWALCAGSWDGVQYALLPWGLPFGSGALGMDTLSRLFLFPVFGLGAVCGVAGAHTLGSYPAEEHNLAAHWLFYCLLILSLAVVMTARDAVLFLIAWEIMSLVPFFLIDFDDEEAHVRQASWIYLVAAHLGAVFLLALFALLWQLAGSTSFSAFSQAAGSIASSPLVSLLFLLALTGFGAKSGLAPLHVWLPEAHPIAPSHISAIMSGVMINAGVYGFIRCLDFFGPLHSAPAWWGWAVVAVGLSTGLVGIFKATAQSNIKRLLAYSSVENMGLIFMGLGAALVGARAGNAWVCTLGFAGALFHMLNHAAYKSLLFLSAGEILHAVNSVRFEHLGGLQKKLPVLGLCFGLGAASIACLPPFNGFASELVLALSLAGGLELPGMEQQLGLLGTLVGLALISGLAAATFAKAYGIAFLGEARTGGAHNPTPTQPIALACLVVPAAACLGLGLGAPWVFESIAPAALSLSAPSADLLPKAVDAVVHMGNILYIVTAVSMGGIALTLALSAWRKTRNLTNGIRRAPTWGCGYQAGTARIQYSAASFSEPTAKLLAASMGLKTRYSMDKNFFPTRASLSVTASDRVLDHVLSPAFEGIARVCNALKIFQHGRIHLYILYMLLTVIALLIWGLHA
ncbi:MAG: proton-conducting transporter membrane subunit [Desulfovibrionaceae bacterium]